MMEVMLVIKPARGKYKEMTRTIHAKSAADLFAQLMDKPHDISSASYHHNKPGAYYAPLKAVQGASRYPISFAKMPSDPDALDEYIGSWWKRAERVLRVLANH